MEVAVSDGTLYTIHTQQRWGLLVWAAVRGEIRVDHLLSTPPTRSWANRTP